MKTTTAIKMILSLTLLASAFLAKAQSTFVSFQVSNNVTGSGLGANICPSIALTCKKSTFSIGPNFQRREMNFSGVQASYRYSAAKNANKKMELFFSCNFILQKAAYMSKGYVEIEKSCHPEEKDCYENMKLNVIEFYGGIGLKVNPAKCFSAAFSTGIGMYNTLDKQYDREMYRQKSALVMQMKLTLIYNIRLKAEKNKVIPGNSHNAKL